LPAACVAIGWSAGSEGGGPVPSISSLIRTLRGAGTGWARVLTTVPPLGPDPAVLAAVSALAALATFGAVQTALRTEAVLPVAAPGFVVLVLGLLATGPGSDLPVAVAFAVATAALTAVAAAPATGSIARYAAALPAVAGVCAVSLLSATTASGRPPFDPRTLVTPPPATHPALDPLQQVAAWVGTPQTRLFTIDTSTDASANPATGPAPSSPTAAPDLRLTVLDHFDGGTWSSDAVYTATGSRIPAAPAAESTPTTDLRQDIRIEQLNTLWLPAPARPTTVTALPNQLTVDADGELLIPDGTKPGLHYTVTAHVPQYSEAALRGAVPVADPVATALPGDVPPIIAQTAQNATAGAGFPYQQAARLADYLRTTAAYDPTAPAGDGYGHIAYFLGTSHRGGSDQFAVAFALMARSLGLPARVAVGFAPTAPHTAADEATGGTTDTTGATGAAANPTPGRTTVTVTGADALAWPEVDFAGLGWVPFFPTPSGPGRGGALHLASGESAVRQSVDDTLTGVKLPAPQPLPPPDSWGAPTGSDVRSSGTSGLSIAVVVFVCSISLITAYLGYALGIPQLRRHRRRRAPDPAAAVLGAWWETVTMLRTLGLEAVGSRTTAQIAAFGAARLGADGARALTVLARLADHAAFAPATSGVTGAAAVEAWSGYATVRGAVRATVPRRIRLLHRLIPPSPLPPRKV
ncbi:MAG: hypothetical protein HOW97_40180, partial [Catenulispora sp.]|nr:hypothetical protein [Catenulispora sp.]